MTRGGSNATTRLAIEGVANPAGAVNGGMPGWVGKHREHGFGRCADRGRRADGLLGHGGWSPIPLVPHGLRGKVLSCPTMETTRRSRTHWSVAVRTGPQPAIMSADLVTCLALGCQLRRRPCLAR